MLNNQVHRSAAVPKARGDGGACVLVTHTLPFRRCPRGGERLHKRPAIKVPFKPDDAVYGLVRGGVILSGAGASERSRRTPGATASWAGGGSADQSAVLGRDGCAGAPRPSDPGRALP